MEPEIAVKNQPASSNSSAAQLEWTPKRVFTATLFITGVLLGLWLIFNFSSALIILLVAIMIGTGLKPVLSWLTEHGIPALIGEALIFLMILGLIFTLLGLTLPIIVKQATDLNGQLSEYYRDLRAMMVNSPSEVMHGIGLRLSARLEAENLAMPSQSDPFSQSEQSPAKDAADLVASSFHSTGLIINGLLALLAIFLLAFYWTVEGERVIRSLLLLAPANKRDYLQDMITTIESKLGGFLLGQFLLCMVIAGLSLVAYLLIGLPNAFILAIIAGIFEAVPVVGPIMGALPALAIAVSLGPDKIVMLLLATGIIQLLENNFLVPRVMNRTVGVHPFLTLLSLAIFSSLFGLGGALLAVPMAAIFQYLINRFVIMPLQEPNLSSDRRDYGTLLQLKAKELISDLRHQNNKLDEGFDQPDPVQEQIEALADELVQILKQQS